MLALLAFYKTILSVFLSFCGPTDLRCPAFLTLERGHLKWGHLKWGISQKRFVFKLEFTRLIRTRHDSTRYFL